MKAIKAILFDLDDTLLGNPMETFLPGYFARLGRFITPYMNPDLFIDGLLRATNKMVAEPDLKREVSNHGRLWHHFEQELGLSAAEYEQILAQFYADQFPKLAPLTQPKEAAVPLVEYCFAQEWQVVVATNPLFPRTAIEQRLDWAGLPVERYPFALVTSFEEVHAAKPHPAYYEEILDQLDVDADEAMMVGDSWENDIEPTHRLGMRSYWIQLDQPGPPDEKMIMGWGTLAQFFDGLRKKSWG